MRQHIHLVTLQHILSTSHRINLRERSQGARGRGLGIGNDRGQVPQQLMDRLESAGGMNDFTSRRWYEHMATWDV